MMIGLRFDQILYFCVFTLVLGLTVVHFTGTVNYSILSFHNMAVQYAFGSIHLITFLFLIVQKGSWNRYIATVLLCSISILTILSTLSEYVESGFVIEQIIEHSVKIFTPIGFIIYIHQKKSFRHLADFFKIMLALTFIGHGIFALGLNYIPGNFMSMTVTILGINYSGGENFLFVAGILDLIVATTIFIDMYGTFSLYYMAFWGLITALARTFYGIMVADDLEGILFFMGNSIYRLPHCLLPLVLISYYRWSNRPVMKAV
jgi:hypothetical protein